MVLSSTVFTSDLADIETGDRTVHGLVLEACAAHRGRVALVDGRSDTLTTYAELEDRVRRLAGGLLSRGLAPGDVLAICAPNIPATAEMALGAMAAGMTVAMLSPGSTPEELSHQLAACRAGTLFTVPPFAEMVCSVGHQAGVTEVIVAGDAPDCTPLSQLAAARPLSELPGADAGQTAVIFRSSGTTDLPKGVELSHRAIVSAVRQAQALLQLTAWDVSVTVTPLFHVMGFVAMLCAPLSAGAGVVTMPRFEPQLFMDLVDRHKVTVVAAAPPMAPVLLAENARDRLGSLEVIVSSGSALARPLEIALQDRFPMATVGQGWGLTEVPGVSVPRRGHSQPVGSVGKLVPNTRLRVVDIDTGRDVPAGRTGELWVSGPHLMTGYLDDPVATAERLGGDGWLHTGDLGHVDSEGYVFLEGRAKDLVRSDGIRYGPAEIEEVLLTHPSVADAVVVGRPDAERGEAPVAFVVMRSEVSEGALLAWVAERVEPHRQLREVRFIDAIPRSPAGKILRRLLGP